MLFYSSCHRWTRREQTDFYRVVSTFGVEYDPDNMQFHWDRFRTFARLDKKTDESLTKYFHGFVAMCRQVCRLPPAAGDGEIVESRVNGPVLLTDQPLVNFFFHLYLLQNPRTQICSLSPSQKRERLGPSTVLNCFGAYGNKFYATPF